MGDAVSLHLQDTQSGTVCHKPRSSFQQTSALCKMADYCFGRLLLAFFLFSYLFAVQQLFPLGIPLGFDASPTCITWGSCPGSQEPPPTAGELLNFVTLCIGKHPCIPKLTPNPPKSLTLNLRKPGWLLAKGDKTQPTTPKPSHLSHLTQVYSHSPQNKCSQEPCTASVVSAAFFLCLVWFLPLDVGQEIPAQMKSN